MLAVIACLAQPATAQDETQTAQMKDVASGLLDRIRGVRTGVPPKAPGDLACRSERDAVADRVIRLHTQLMVASLACGGQYGDEDAYTRYRLFTRQHADLLRRSQSTIENSFADNGAQAFDAYRTNLANDESTILNDTSTPSYCRMRRARFESLILTNPDMFPDYARELAVRDRIYKAC